MNIPGADKPAVIICTYDYSESMENKKFPNLGLKINKGRETLKEAAKDLININSDGRVEYVFINHQHEILRPDFNLKLFPFDSHLFSVGFRTSSMKNVKFKPVRKFQENWQDAANNGYASISLPNFSLIEVTVNVTETDFENRIEYDFTSNRIAYSFIYKVIVPALILIFISFFGRLIKDQSWKFFLVTSILFIVIAINLTVADNLPSLSFQTLFNTFTFLSICSLLFNLFVLILENRINKVLSEKQNKYFIYGFFLSYPFINLVTMLITVSTKFPGFIQIVS